MRIGLELLTASPFGWSELRDAAVSLEDVGFDSVWVPDHIEKEMNGQTYPFFESIALLGGIADATTRIKIGASVHNAALRHPFQLAHAAVTLDEISSGRLILGVGAGGGGYEHRFLGQPTGSRFPKFAESVEVLAGLLDGSEVDFDGPFESVPISVGKSDDHHEHFVCPGHFGDMTAAGCVLGQENRPGFERAGLAVTGFDGPFAREIDSQNPARSGMPVAMPARRDSFKDVAA